MPRRIRPYQMRPGRILRCAQNDIIKTCVLRVFLQQPCYLPLELMQEPRICRSEPPSLWTRLNEAPDDHTSGTVTRAGMTNLEPMFFFGQQP